jgi:hypothetical protein
MSCPYKYILGVPEQGVHAARILGVSLNDSLMTIIGAAIISYFSGYSFLWTLLILFVLGEYLHMIFGVQTAFLTIIGVKACS